MRRKFHILLSIIILMMMFSSCATPKVILFGEAYPPKSLDATIDVYSTNKPSVNYKEIGQITCGDEISSESSNMKQILKKAREIGADGIILIGKAGTSSIGMPVGSFTYYTSESYGIRAIAIKYNNP